VALLIVLALTACGTTSPLEPRSSASIRLRRIVEEGVTGYEARILVAASPRVVEKWLVDFDGIAPDRPNVLDASLVRREPGGWISRFRFRGYVGIHPTVVVRTTRRTRGRSVILDFRATELSFGLTALFGSYRITPHESGGAVLTHRLFVATPFATRIGLEADMREDAEAIVEALAQPE
jgi:Polyketide cyclase / dehydrase and lipid transport